MPKSFDCTQHLLTSFMNFQEPPFDRFPNRYELCTFLCFNHPSRYDVRNRLEDKSQFGLKPNIPHKISAEEEQLEDMLDKERYLSLDCDILEEALREGTLTDTFRRIATTHAFLC